MPAASPIVRLLRSAALACVAAATVGAAPASALTLGFNDDNLAFYSGWQGQKVDEPALAAGLAHGHEAGARTWRFMLRWRDVASGSAIAPTPAQAVDPNWSGYRWDDVDRMVRSITAAGMAPLPWVARAPGWAEGAGRPTDLETTPPGTWKVSASALGGFAQALAKRYSGTFPDPGRAGQALPRVGTFQAWNEPNLYSEITPQWEKVRGTWKVSSVGQYRAMLAAFYAGVKKAQPTAVVLAAGTGPFGGLYPGDTRLPPARFWRELLCATQRGTTVTIKKKGCAKVRFDGWAHHTYPIGPPTRTARNVDDVVVPDMAKLTRVLKAAAKSGIVTKKAAANLWITEMSWDSFPDPEGLSLADHALYMEGAFYQLWKAGVQNILWWNSRDNAKGSDWNATLQSGIFLRGADPTQDTPKPAYTAYRFPFVAYRTKGVAALWSRPPAGTPVVVQAQDSAGAWKNVATLSSKGGGVVTGRLRVGPRTNLRAVQGADISLVWRTF